MTEPAAYLSVHQAAEFLGISHTTVYRYIDRGVLPAVRAYGSAGPLRIPRPALKEMILTLPVVKSYGESDHVDDPPE